jgi:hypothetical protein
MCYMWGEHMGPCLLMFCPRAPSALNLLDGGGLPQLPFLKWKAWLDHLLPWY